MRVLRDIALTCALLFGVAAWSSAQQPTGMAALTDNEEYNELMRNNIKLGEDIDSLTTLMNDVRNGLRASFEAREQRTQAERDSISKLIISLEQQVFDLRDERGTITNRINSIEQEWVLMQFNNPNEAIAVGSIVYADEYTEPQRRNLIDNRCFVDALNSEDYASLQASHESMIILSERVDEYVSRYEAMSDIYESYMATNDESVADSLFEAFNTLEAENIALDKNIQESWRRILDTKYYSLSYILEKHQRTELLDQLTDSFAEMDRAFAENEGYYASDGVMRYAVGYPTLIDAELSFARSMELSEAADSLAEVQSTIPLPDYHIEELIIERRYFIDYEPIVFGKTYYYTNANPIPQLKVYEHGTIYRILLGSFRKMQNLSIFKGVRPLYIDHSDDYYRYYVGGFATLTEADEAAQMLRDKGFRSPQVCRWVDGSMENLSRMAKEEDKDISEVAAESDLRFMVEITTESLSSDIEATIEAVSPGKRISRAGGKFVVSTFAQRSEAEALADALRTMFDDTDVTIKEIALNQ